MIMIKILIFIPIIVNMTDNLNVSVELSNSTLTIKYPEVTYPYWKSLLPYYDDETLEIILQNLIVSLDCSIVFSGMRVIMTSHMNYDMYVSRYYYYLLHLENQFKYNLYFNLLCIAHQENIDFEANNPIPEKPVQTKGRDFGKMKTQPKYIRQVTTDLITGKEVYKYIHKKTGEIITSEDPNLLETLGKRVKKEPKEKRTKVVPISLDSMVFSFKKKT